ncbi:MAG: hypothetical protein HFH82_04290 [Lachnospiraceae bacterium]|nr:hypothetical protein [Lachnospiraceae bacterium]
MEQDERTNNRWKLEKPWNLTNPWVAGEAERFQSSWEVQGMRNTRNARKGKRLWKRLTSGKLLLSLASLVLLTMGIILFYVRVYQVAPAFNEIVYEYGEQVSRDITDYLTGTDWSVHLGELDLSLIDEEKTGIYEARVTHGSKQFSYRVIIEDTQKPEILWKEEQVYLAVGDICTVEDMIRGVSDADPGARAFFWMNNTAYTKLQFDVAGEFEIGILARDRSGNETKGKVSVIVDTPPTFSGIRNFYVVPGSEPDYLDTVEAWDDVDGDLTKAVWVDDSEVKLDREGMYSLRYVAEDSYGLETVEVAQVLVADADDIQDLIGCRQIDYRVDAILGAPNIYDAGASEYEDMRETLEYMRPALVQLYHGTGRGGYSSGSGYIMEITDEYIYICTNRHVVDKYENWDVYFFNGTKLPGKKLGVSETYDVGVAVIDRKDVPESLLRQLMTIHIDKTYWESLDQQSIEMALERVDRKGGLIHTARGNLIKVKQEFDWYGKLEHTEVTVELVHGDSGSALMDGYGNLICMAYAFSTDPVRYWCIPLDAILECYEEITGHMPYVY